MIKSVFFGVLIGGLFVYLFELRCYIRIVPVNGTVFGKGGFRLDTLRERARQNDLKSMF